MHVVVVGLRAGGLVARRQPRPSSGHTVAVDRPPGRGLRPPRRRLHRHAPSPASASTATACARPASSRPARVAAVTNGDNSNILIARVARETFGIERVVARIYDPRRAAIYQRLGIPTVATVAWTTERVLRRILPDEPAVEWVDPSAKVMLVERVVPAGVGRARRSTSSRSPARSRVVAVSRLGVAPGAQPGLCSRRATSSTSAVAGDAHRRSSTRHLAGPARGGH